MKSAKADLKQLEVRFRKIKTAMKRGETLSKSDLKAIEAYQHGLFKLIRTLKAQAKRQTRRKS